MLTFLIPLLLVIIVLGLMFGKPYLREIKRRKIKSAPFKKEWRKIIQKRIPYFRHMPANLQLQLKEHILIFLAEKRFVGKNGIVINDEVKVTIAAQACLLLLNRKVDYYPNLKTILVYPHAFVKQQQVSGADGVHFIQHANLAGESWSFGTIVLSWRDTLNGAQLPDDGHNVVIHEFAHQLDQEAGFANGAPVLGKEQSYQSWSEVFSAHYDLLVRQAHTNEPSIFDYYGATNPAEFFAVASEVFFEKAEALKQEHPLLYAQLSTYYHVDPASW